MYTWGHFLAMLRSFGKIWIMTIEHDGNDLKLEVDGLDQAPIALLVNLSLRPDPIAGESAEEYAQRHLMLAAIMTELGFDDC